METKQQREREEVYSQTVKAGKRTYFFDVRETRAGDRFLTITESKRRFDDSTGQFAYDKHKIFLYKEDQEKFLDALTNTIEYIQTGIKPEEDEDSNTINLDF